MVIEMIQIVLHDLEFKNDNDNDNENINNDIGDASAWTHEFLGEHW